MKYKVRMWSGDEYCKHAQAGDVECIFSLEVEAESKFQAGHRASRLYHTCQVYEIHG
jgi:hypothetical protein